MFATDDNTTDDIHVIRARGRLADAKKIFASRGWDVLPQGRRGQRILRWGADHAWIACPTNPMRSVRNWCRKWAPWCKGAELTTLLEYVKTSGKRWSNDQCATTLEISVRDRSALSLRFIGADDDPNYEIRLGIRKAKAAARARRFRAAHSTGGKRGRPALKVALKCVTPHNNIDSVTEFSATPWDTLGMSRRTYFRHKAAGTLPIPTAIPASAIDGIDFAKFGITAVRVMCGTDVLRAWLAAT